MGSWRWRSRRWVSNLRRREIAAIEIRKEAWYVLAYPGEEGEVFYIEENPPDRSAAGRASCLRSLESKKAHQNISFFH